MKDLFLVQRRWRAMSLLVIGGCLQACSPDFMEGDPGKVKPEVGVLMGLAPSPLLTLPSNGAEA